MPFKLSGVLPRNDRNGIDVVFDDVMRNPESPMMVVASLLCTQISSDPRSRNVTATLRIEAIEALNYGDDRWADARDLLLRQHEWRTGKVPLPLDE